MIDHTPHCAVMKLTPSAIERRKTYISAFVARAAKEADVYAQSERVEEAYAVLDKAINWLAREGEDRLRLVSEMPSSPRPSPTHRQARAASFTRVQTYIEGTTDFPSLLPLDRPFIAKEAALLSPSLTMTTATPARDPISIDTSSISVGFGAPAAVLESSTTTTIIESTEASSSTSSPISYKSTRSRDSTVSSCASSLLSITSSSSSLASKDTWSSWGSDQASLTRNPLSIDASSSSTDGDDDEEGERSAASTVCCGCPSETCDDATSSIIIAPASQAAEGECADFTRASESPSSSLSQADQHEREHEMDEETSLETVSAVQMSLVGLDAEESERQREATPLASASVSLSVSEAASVKVGSASTASPSLLPHHHQPSCTSSSASASSAPVVMHRDLPSHSHMPSSTSPSSGPLYPAHQIPARPPQLPSLPHPPPTILDQKSPPARAPRGFHQPSFKSFFSSVPLVRRTTPGVPLLRQFPAPPCNRHYLLERGCQDPECKYTHDFLLTPEEVQALRLNSKKSPCAFITRSGRCADGPERCHMGHSCPYGPECCYGANCKFLPFAGMHSAPAITRHPSSYSEANGTVPFHANKAIRALEGDPAAIEAFLVGRRGLASGSTSRHGDDANRQHHRQQQHPSRTTAPALRSSRVVAPAPCPAISSQGMLAPMRTPQQPASQQPAMVVKQISAHSYHHPSPAPHGKNALHSTSSSASGMAVPAREASGGVRGAAGSKKKGKKAAVRETSRVGSGRFSPLGHIRA